jgi:hypothetical protein
MRSVRDSGYHILGFVFRRTQYMLDSPVPAW